MMTGDIVEDEGEEDWSRQGWRSETGSLFQTSKMRWCMSEWTVLIYGNGSRLYMA